MVEDKRYEDFLRRFQTLPAGFKRVLFRGRKYGMTIEISEDTKRRKLFAKELGGTDHVSFNMYQLNAKPPLLKPCEMSASKVIDFVLGFQPAN